MPRTDILDELGLYLIEKKNSQPVWTSLRDICDAIRSGIKDAEFSERFQRYRQIFASIDMPQPGKEPTHGT